MQFDHIPAPLVLRTAGIERAMQRMLMVPSFQAARILTPDLEAILSNDDTDRPTPFRLESVPTKDVLIRDLEHLAYTYSHFPIPFNQWSSLFVRWLTDMHLGLHSKQYRIAPTDVFGQCFYVFRLYHEQYGLGWAVTNLYLTDVRLALSSWYEDIRPAVAPALKNYFSELSATYRDLAILVDSPT